VTSSDSPPKIVITSNGEFGDILTDSSGMTLYIFDRDTEGVSNCPGGCLGNWPPLLTEYGAVAIGDITGTIATIDRGDGIKQVTINGFPAYYWKGDVTEGETSGNGAGNNWWDSTLMERHSDLQRSHSRNTRASAPYSPMAPESASTCSTTTLQACPAALVAVSIVGPHCSPNTELQQRTMSLEHWGRSLAVTARFK
jgi:predicted lipoprotein with Yx(FWY)xxD motif